MFQMLDLSSSSAGEAAARATAKAWRRDSMLPAIASEDPLVPSCMLWIDPASADVTPVVWPTGWRTADECNSACPKLTAVVSLAAVDLKAIAQTDDCAAPGDTVTALALWELSDRSGRAVRDRGRTRIFWGPETDLCKGCISWAAVLRDDNKLLRWEGSDVVLK